MRNRFVTAARTARTRMAASAGRSSSSPSPQQSLISRLIRRVRSAVGR